MFLNICQIILTSWYRLSFSFNLRFFCFFSDSDFFLKLVHFCIILRYCSSYVNLLASYDTAAAGESRLLPCYGSNGCSLGSPPGGMDSFLLLDWKFQAPQMAFTDMSEEMALLLLGKGSSLDFPLGILWYHSRGKWEVTSGPLTG